MIIGDNMLLVSYDIANDKLRTRFARYLSKFGYRLQYSVFEIRNSERLLDNIIIEIETVYGKEFKDTDSVIILNLNQQCKKYCFGYAAKDKPLMIID